MEMQTGASQMGRGNAELRRTPAPSVVTPRSVVIGLLLVPLNVYWVIFSEFRLYNVLTLNPLFVTPVFYLFALVCLNCVLRRAAARFVFCPAEMLVIYVMLVMSCTIATHDYIINAATSMTWAHWLANDSNGWSRSVLPFLPKWLTVSDRFALRGYFQGNSSMYSLGVLRAWMLPVVFWSLFIFVCGWVMMCLTVIFRKAWMDDVRLSFPIVRLPMSLLDPEESAVTLRNPLLWMGFGAAAGIALLNGLHLWFPNLPVIQVRAVPITPTQPPWSAMGGTVMSFYPFAIGLAYLVPLDISFSCWFFHLFVKAQSVIGYQLGYGNTPSFPFVHEQGIGAWFAFGAALLYASRRHLRRVWRIALGSEPGAGSREPLSYRTAVFGLIAGVALLLWFWRAAGMGVIWAAFTLFAYLLVSVSITRVRAEAGGQHAVWDLEPMNLTQFFGSNALGSGNIAASAVSHWFWRLNRSHMMPGMLESFKLADGCSVSMKSLVRPVLAALGISVIFGFWACMHIGCSEGVLARCQGNGGWTAYEQFGWLSGATQNGFRPEPARWLAAGGAAGLVAVLSVLRARYSWFPLHPLGYCIGNELRWHWMPFLVAWAVKLIVLRYGGLSLYRKSLPFALGMVLGDYTMAAVWSLIGVIWRVPTYQVFH